MEIRTLCRDGEEAGRIVLSVRYEQHSADRNDLVKSIKKQVCDPQSDRMASNIRRPCHSDTQACMQAVGQLIADDWCWTTEANWEDWEETEKFLDWRFSGIITEQQLAAAEEGAAIDIEGMPWSTL